MKLSTKGRYGVKAMFELAICYGHNPISIKTIAERQSISDYYLEQLFSGLRKAGLINSIRGAQGGYMLSRCPKDISIADILNVLEGPIEISECILGGEESSCTKARCCSTRLLWKKISDSVNSVIDNTTLQDLVDDYKDMNSDKGE
ncbi:MAG: Rrf2 family transcriptional regulator [Clostridium sp.]